MSNTLNSEFSKKIIPTNWLDFLWNELRRTSSLGKKLDNLRQYLTDYVKDLFLETVVSKELREVLPKCSRLLTYQTGIIGISPESLGLNKNTVSFTFRYRSDNNLLPKVPMNNSKGEPLVLSYWRETPLSLDMISDETKKSRLKYLLFEYKKTSEEYNDFLIDLKKDRYSPILTALWQKPTWGNLFSYNKEWFDILVRKVQIDEEEMYGSSKKDESSTDLDTENDDIEKSIILLRKILES